MSVFVWSVGVCVYVSECFHIYYWENVHSQNIAGKMSNEKMFDGKLSTGKMSWNRIAIYLAIFTGREHCEIWIHSQGKL